ncbi:MAG TPA: cyclic nucleotide-binding domain-containing protein [Candidatus Limnocylindria bacterium]|nr:cyclic nucleotide-binding domain-containing protein [Candidatus Limnocylindria bacterium]
MRRRRFTAGEFIFREGDPSHEAFLLHEGRVEIVKSSPRGPFRLAVLHEGDVFGEMGLVEERPRSASARALDDVTADAVNAAEFAEMLTHDLENSHRILRVLFERLRAVNARLSEAAPPEPPVEVPGALRLVPLTTETRAVLPADGVPVRRLPFRVGRAPAPGPALLHYNELELPDRDPYVLSPNHFSIDAGEHGLVVRDRGSLHGTYVNGERIGGGAKTDVARVSPGDNEIVAGPLRPLAARRASPFRFRVVIG